MVVILYRLVRPAVGREVCPGAGRADEGNGDEGTTAGEATQRPDVLCTLPLLAHVQPLQRQRRLAGSQALERSNVFSQKTPPVFLGITRG